MRVAGGSWSEARDTLWTERLLRESIMECVSFIEMNWSRYPNCDEKNDNDGCNTLGEMAGRMLYCRLLFPGKRYLEAELGQQ